MVDFQHLNTMPAKDIITFLRGCLISEGLAENIPGLALLLARDYDIRTVFDRLIYVLRTEAQTWDGIERRGETDE